METEKEDFITKQEFDEYLSRAYEIISAYDDEAFKTKILPIIQTEDFRTVRACGVIPDEFMPNTRGAFSKIGASFCKIGILSDYHIDSMEDNILLHALTVIILGRQISKYHQCLLEPYD